MDFKAVAGRTISFFVIAILSLAINQTECFAQNEAVFSAASKYTVKIRSVVEYPTINDRRGVFSGAGFVVDLKRGWIATNAHVVGRVNKSVDVKFKDGEYKPAKLIYFDSYLDFAVISIETTSLPTFATEASLNCKDRPALGVAVGAFGHPYGLDFTGTRGIVSGTKFRWSRNWIQTDASINSGNSGGPLIEFETGGVIGINTSSLSKSSSDGISFSIPSPDFCPVIDLLRDGLDPNPVLIPAAIALDHDKETGLNVMRIYQRLPVHWDLREGDRLQKLIYGDQLGGSYVRKLETPADLITGLRTAKGSSAKLALIRDNNTITVPIDIKRRASVLSQRFVYVSGVTIGQYELTDDELNNSERLLVVHNVRDSSKANVAGLRRRDLIKSVDGRLFQTPERLAEYLEKKHYKTVSFNIMRRQPDYGQSISHKLIRVELDQLQRIGAW